MKKESVKPGNKCEKQSIFQESEFVEKIRIKCVTFSKILETLGINYLNLKSKSHFK